MKAKKSESNIEAILDDLRRNPEVAKMEQYIQHGKVSTLEHCQRVARLSVRINRFLHLHGDERAIIRGAALHDFYLYDWHIPSEDNYLHGFRHPNLAVKNAQKYVGIGDKERRIIQSHMWPLTITKIPTCREAWIVCFADKWCSLFETLFMR